MENMITNQSQWSHVEPVSSELQKVYGNMAVSIDRRVQKKREKRGTKDREKRAAIHFTTN